MQSLLRWSIENSDPNALQASTSQQNADASTDPNKKLDPAIIDMILGKPDAELMKDALTIAVDESRDEDERMQALDDFEMLVEQIDNANSMFTSCSLSYRTDTQPGSIAQTSKN